jgi:hypothetical protein
MSTAEQESIGQTWQVSTDAAPQMAQEVTGIAGWSPGRTWQTPVRVLAVTAVTALRAAGHAARLHQAWTPEAESALEYLREIGPVREAKREAEAALREVLARVDERAMMLAALAAGASVADVARAAGCDRQWVYQQTRGS